jgi:hypothetical protein
MTKRTGWGREFNDPIELPDGRQLVTLEDAGWWDIRSNRISAASLARQTMRRLLMVDGRRRHRSASAIVRLCLRRFLF